MRILVLALASLAMMSTAARAHPEGHDEDPRFGALAPPVQVNIPQAAKQAVVRLVSQARLPASWARVQPATTAQRTRAGERQWVVTFRNPAIRNRARQNLYVIMKPDGSFVSANHRVS